MPADSPNRQFSLTARSTGPAPSFGPRQFAAVWALAGLESGGWRGPSTWFAPPPVLPGPRSFEPFSEEQRKSMTDPIGRAKRSPGVAEWREREQQEEQPRPPGLLVSGPGNVLIADDDQGVLDFLSHVFEPLGFEVTTAANGEEALERFDERGSWSLVVTDVQMGSGPSGLAIVQEIRSSHPGLPVIVAGEEDDNAEPDVKIDALFEAARRMARGRSEGVG